MIEKQDFERLNQEAKADDGKVKLSLVPTEIIRAIAEIREYGNQKYKSPDNWKTVDKQRYIDALYRHWLAYIDGEKVDDESGLEHIKHVACNLAFIIEMDKQKEPICKDGVCYMSEDWSVD